MYGNTMETGDELKLRDSVLAIVAHDIRSPLATITMIASLLEGDAVSEPERQHFLDVIRKATAQIDKLIRDLLDVAHIENGQLALEKFPTSVRPMLHDVIELNISQARAKYITLRLDMPDRDVVIDIDRDRIIELLGNLISNALKFTQEGGSIVILCIPTREHVTIAVSDTGIGIPEDQRDHIFERFWQAQHARRAGAGLGLAICKGIVEAHGGTIRVESETGIGTTFYVVLPI